MRFPQTTACSAVVACLALTACAGGGDGGSGGNARKGGSITVGASGPPDALDPALGRTREAKQALWLVYTPPLTYRRAEGATGTELIPGLAEELPSVSEDGETYSFKIREGLRYSNGKPVRASDFEHTVKRVLRLRAGAHFFSGIEGAREYADGSSEGADISGIVTDDRARSVTIDLDEPDPTFENKLATTFAGMVPRGTPFEDRSRRPPAGVGPYRIAKVSPREFAMTQVRGFELPDVPEGNVQRITTRVVGAGTRRGRARSKDRGGASTRRGRARTEDRGGSIRLGRVRTEDVTEARQAKAVVDGRLDYMQGSLPAELLPEIRSKYEDRYSEQPTLSALYFFLNERTPPFDREKVRKAVNFALDKQALMRLFAGRLEPSCNLLAPGLSSYRRIDPCPYGDPHLSGDPEKARQLIEDADEDGKAVTVLTQEGEEERAVGRYYTGLLDKIGLKANLRVVDAATYRARLARGRGPQTGFARFTADLPHPLPFIRLVRRTVLDPGLEEQVAELSEQPRGEETADRYAELDRRIVDSAYLAPFGAEKVGAFLSERIDAANCALTHRVYGVDYSSLCLK